MCESVCVCLFVLLMFRMNPFDVGSLDEFALDPEGCCTMLCAVPLHRAIFEQHTLTH